MIEHVRIKQAQIVAQPDGARQDMAFTRPRVLILAPFKQTAFQIIEQITLLLNKGKWKKTAKKKKFRQEFGSEEDAYNDFFRIGLGINWSKSTNKLSLKLYEQFYDSDIIVASPLALRMLCGHKIDDKANDLDQKVD